MFFRNFDLDGDGRISFNEYMLFTTLLSIPTEDIEGTNLAHPHRFQLFFLYSSGALPWVAIVLFTTLLSHPHRGNRRLERSFSDVVLEPGL